MEIGDWRCHYNKSITKFTPGHIYDITDLVSLRKSGMIGTACTAYTIMSYILSIMLAKEPLFGKREYKNPIQHTKIETVGSTLY